MAFHEIRLPTTYDYGISGGPSFGTQIVEMPSGQEQRIARQQQGKRSWNIPFNNKTPAQISEIITFFLARQGAAHGFRFKDFHDFTTGADGVGAPSFGNVQIGVGNGSQVQFQLVKKYTSGIITRTRNITKPVSGTVLIGVNGVNQTSGWTVNTSNGLVTFTTAPANGATITAGFEFDVPVRFSKVTDELLNISIDNFESNGIRGFAVSELVDEAETSDEYYYGGAKNWGQIGASVSLSLQDGRVQIFSPQITGLRLILPDPVAAGIPLGGPIFFLTNAGTQNISLSRADLAVIKVIPAGSMATVLLGLDTSSNKMWIAHD